MEAGSNLGWSQVEPFRGDTSPLNLRQAHKGSSAERSKRRIKKGKHDVKRKRAGDFRGKEDGLFPPLIFS
jgi:hypothetical protein